MAFGSPQVFTVARASSISYHQIMLVPESKVRLRQVDGVWIAKSALLPGCHAHGRDRGEAVLRFQEAAKRIWKR